MPNGREGIRVTLAAMRRFVDQYKTHPTIRRLAITLIKDLPQKDYVGEARRLFDYVQFRVRYVRDTNGVEYLQTPLKTLEYGSGDCDDKSTLLAALLESIGFQTRFRAVGFGRGICHVYLEVNINGQWVSCDTTEPQRMGWTPPNISESEYMGGLFSSIKKRIKKVVKSTVKAIKSPLDAVREIARGGDITQSIKGVILDQYKSYREIHKATTPAKVLELERKITDSAGRLMSSEMGGIVTQILSFVPVTAPFAWAVTIARIVAVGEKQRKELNEAYAKASALQQMEFDNLLVGAQWVYDPAVEGIRLKKPGVEDDHLPHYRYNRADDTLVLIKEGTLGTAAAPFQPETVAPAPVEKVAESAPPPLSTVPEPDKDTGLPLKLAITAASILLLS